MDCISQLPDCILSYILTMLSVKDMLKTSVLSRRWCKLWALRRNLNFDVDNVLGSETELLETGYLIDVLENSSVVRNVDWDLSRDEFVKRVDQFVKNFQGTKIDSFLVDFYLNCKESSSIDQWISFAIARGVERIDLLLLERPYAPRRTSCKPYKFAFGLFSESNASTLKHLRLQYCLVCHPTKCDFSPFKNLRSLALEHAKVDEMFITSLLSNCRLLEELCLISCEFKSSMPKIVSSSLCHLMVSRPFVLCKNIVKYLNLSSLDCLKLTSLRYRGHLETLYINTPLLKSIDRDISSREIFDAFALFATLPQLEILHLDIFLTATTSRKLTQPLKHLKQLNLIICWNFLQGREFDLLWILNILQASPLLQKLSVMVTYPKVFENQIDIKDVELFSHDEVKVIELGGCVGNWYEFDFVMNVLKCAHKLERMVLSPYWREHDSLDWNSDPVWFQKGRERIREKLQGVAVVGPAEVWVRGKQYPLRHVAIPKRNHLYCCLSSTIALLSKHYHPDRRVIELQPTMVCNPVVAEVISAIFSDFVHVIPLSIAHQDFCRTIVSGTCSSWVFSRFGNSVEVLNDWKEDPGFWRSSAVDSVRIASLQYSEISLLFVLSSICTSCFNFHQITCKMCTRYLME